MNIWYLKGIHSFHKAQCKKRLHVDFWCQQRQEERRLLNACQTCTYGRTQKTPLAGKSRSQFPVASAAAPRVSNGCIWSATSRFCHGACHRRGTWAWHRQREGASQRDRSEDIWTKKEKMWISAGSLCLLWKKTDYLLATDCYPSKTTSLICQLAFQELIFRPKT